MVGIYVGLFLFGVLFLYCGEILIESVRYLKGASPKFIIFSILSFFDDYNSILLIALIILDGLHIYSFVLSVVICSVVLYLQWYVYLIVVCSGFNSLNVLFVLYVFSFV